jgi:hypothetical protein
MIYLVKDGDEVEVYFRKSELPEGVTADKEIADADYHAAHGYVRVINGEIFLGMTEEEKAESEREMRINESKAKLAEIDREAGAGRAVRGIAVNSAQKAGMSADKDDPNYNEDYERLCGHEARAKAEREKIDALKGGAKGEKIDTR